MIETKDSLGCVLGTRAVESDFRMRIVAAVNQALGDAMHGHPGPMDASGLFEPDASERDALPPLTAWEEWEVAEERSGHNPLHPRG